jgi:hypothetical protein
MADFYVRKGNRLPEIQVTLTDSAGAAVNLTGLTVKFHMRALNSTTAKVNAAATLVTPASGIVKYTWVTADTDTAGSYWAEWEVTFGDGRTQTFKNPDYTSICVTEALA